MIVVRDTETLKGKRLVATIGFFDGVHLGHRFLIHELKQVAEAAGLPSAVITFPEHPRAVLHADYQPKRRGLPFSSKWFEIENRLFHQTKNMTAGMPQKFLS